MITASAEFAAAIKQSSRRFRARLLDRGTELGITIRRLAIYKGSCGASAFTPGAVFSPYIEATADHYGNILEGKMLELQLGVMIGGTLDSPVFDYIRIGFFKVGKPKTNTGSTTFAAYGRIQSILGENMFSLNPAGTGMPCIADIMERIETITGVSIEARDGIDTSILLGGMFFTKVIANELSCRDALAAAAFIAGGYATETADGVIAICRYSTAVTAEYIAADVMTAPPEFHDLDTEITGVKVTVASSTVYSEGDPVNLDLENSYMTEYAFSSFATALIGLTYRGGEVTLALGDPRLEPWDTLRVIDADGASFILPCMNLCFIYDGGLQTNCAAPSIEDDGNARTLEKALSEARKAADAASDVQARADAGEFDAVTLRIDSSRGVLFKNNYFDTTLTVTIYKGTKIITNAAAMKSEFGIGAYLQWWMRGSEDEDWKVMSVDDPHITNSGFTLTVSPDDVDEKIVFKCVLEV